MDILLMFKLGLLFFVVLMSTVYFFYNPDAQQDSPVEEIVEEVIKELTGQDVDLSPGSKEEDKNGNKK